MARVVAIGECMVELTQDRAGTFQLGYAGDTFNTAIYLARLGLDVDYATALGDDPHSDGVITMMAHEQVGTALVSQMPGRSLGLYLIQNDADGERRFSYWRDRAPIREIFSGPSPEWGEAILAADSVYLSGITLGVLGAGGRHRLCEWLAAARHNGALIFFDANYREQLWESPDQAMFAFEAVLSKSDIVSASVEDIAAVWSKTDILPVWAALGIEVVERCRSLEVIVHAGGDKSVIAAQPVSALDATGAGDSFNAAYLAARLGGASPAVAARAGHRLAALVVARRGAILPVGETPDAATLMRTI